MDRVFTKEELKEWLYDHNDGELICECGNKFFSVIKTSSEDVTVTTAFCCTCSNGYFLASNK